MTDSLDPRKAADEAWSQPVPDDPVPPQHISTKRNGAAGGLRSRALSWAQLQGLGDPAYVVKGIIDKGAFVEIYGAFGSGKSFLVGDLGLRVALGWSWFDRRVNQGGVLYIAAEGWTNIKRRLEAFAKHHKVDLDAVPFRVVLDPTNMLTPAGIEQLIADAAPVPDLTLIIIDTAARVMPGGKEDTEDMGKFVSACDEVRSKTGAAVVVVHHSGKTAERGSRGSVVLPAAVDAMLEVTVDEKSKVSTLQLVKSRDGATGANYGFCLEVVLLGQDVDGERPPGQARQLRRIDHSIQTDCHFGPSSNDARGRPAIGSFRSVRLTVIPGCSWVLIYTYNRQISMRALDSEPFLFHGTRLLGLLLLDEAHRGFGERITESAR